MKDYMDYIYIFENYGVAIDLVRKATIGCLEK
jgi:hypothetical protein